MREKIGWIIVSMTKAVKTLKTQLAIIKKFTSCVAKTWRLSASSDEAWRHRLGSPLRTPA